MSEQFNAYKAKYSKETAPKKAVSQGEIEKTPITFNAYKTKYNKEMETINTNPDAVMTGIQVPLDATVINSDLVQTASHNCDSQENSTDSSTDVPTTSISLDGNKDVKINPYKDKLERKQAEILLEAVRKREDTERKQREFALLHQRSFLSNLFQVPQLSFPSARTSASNFLHSNGRSLVLLVTVGIMLRIIWLFYELTFHSHQSKSKKKRSKDISDATSFKTKLANEKEFSAKLQILTNHICHLDSDQFKRNFLFRTSSRLNLADIHAKSEENGNNASQHADDEEEEEEELQALLELKSILKDFRKNDIAEIFSAINHRNISSSSTSTANKRGSSFSQTNEDSSTRETGDRSGQRKLLKWRKNVFDEFKVVEMCMKHLSGHFEDFLNQEKKLLLTLQQPETVSRQSTSFQRFSVPRFPSISRSHSTNQPVQKNNTLLSAQKKYEKLLLLKEISRLYYEYIQKNLQIVSFCVHHHESFQIHDVITVLEKKIQFYTNSNSVYDQHTINEFVSNQSFLQCYLSNTQIFDAGKYSPVKESALKYHEEDLQSIISECEKIINDFYESKKLEIETEEKEFVRSQQQKFQQFQLVQQPLLQSVEQQPMINWTDESNYSAKAQPPNPYLGDMKPESCKWSTTSTQAFSISRENSGESTPGSFYIGDAEQEEEKEEICVALHPSKAPQMLTTTVYQQNQLISPQQRDRSVTVSSATNDNHQQTLQLFQFMQHQQHESNYRKRILQLDSERKVFYKDDQQHSVQKLDAIRKTQYEKHQLMEQEIKQIDKEYAQENQKINKEINLLLNLLYYTQKNKNLLIFQIYFVGIIFLILVLTSKYDLQCLTGGHDSLVARNIHCMFQCLFKTVEEVCHQINVKTSVSSFLYSSTPMASSANTAASTSSTSILYSLIPTMVQLYSLTNPLSSVKWSSCLFLLEKGFFYLLSYFAVTPQGFMKTSLWYYEIVLCLLNLSIRFIPIAITKKIFQLLSIQWNENIISANAFHYNQLPTGASSSLVTYNSPTSSDSKHPLSFLTSMISNFIRSLTALQIFKYLLYLYCYLDILNIIFRYFYDLFFWAFLIHWSCYQLFHSFNLRLIFIQENRNYIRFYVCYGLFLIGTIVFIAWNNTQT
jgi:hypothetical protein